MGAGKQRTFGRTNSATASAHCSMHHSF